MDSWLLLNRLVRIITSQCLFTLLVRLLLLDLFVLLVIQVQLVFGGRLLLSFLRRSRRSWLLSNLSLHLVLRQDIVWLYRLERLQLQVQIADGLIVLFGDVSVEIWEGMHRSIGRHNHIRSHQ